MYQIQQTDVFAKWLSGLRDVRSKARILVRLDSARLGNMGDVVSVGGGVSEIRVDVGAGYRVYFTRRQRVVVILAMWWRQVYSGQGYRQRQANR